MEAECSVAVCVKCEHQLAMEYGEFEKKKIAVGQRPYFAPEATNGGVRTQTSGAPVNRSTIVKHSSQDDGSSETDRQRPSSEPVSHTTDPVQCQSTSSSPGLPSVGKPPPLNMVSPGAKIQRTTATVPPMNQVSPSSSITSHGNNAMSATRNSSFAAALRKLAKQAGDPPDVGGILRDSAPEPSPASVVTSPRTPTPKRVHPATAHAPPPVVYNNSPPVVTIAPTPSHHNTATDSRKSVERAAGAPSSSSNAAMIEPLGIKLERDKLSSSGGSSAGPPGGSSHDRREDDRPHSKDSSLPKPLSSHPMNSSGVAPPAAPGVSSASREEAPRGFQPYRPGEDLRHALPPHFPLDAAAAAAYSAAVAYPAAFMPPHLAHPALRFDDPLLLERYRMMQSPLLSGIPGYPSMLPHPGMPLLHPGSRYPPELLAQHYPLMSPKLPDHRSPGAGVDRKMEEDERREREGRERLEREERERREREEQERRERERLDKERQERERLERERQERERQERERIERERVERERERERQLSLERLRHDAERKSPARNDEAGRYVGSITTGTPRDALYSDKYRNAVYPPKPYPGLGGAGIEGLTQSHLADKERGRQFMHEQVRHLYTEQYLRQQEALMREHGMEKRDHDLLEKATLNSHASKEDSRHVRTSETASFHRTFPDRPLTNGYEHNHFSDYDRRLMTENILAQDRQILQDQQQRPRSRPNSGHNSTGHSDSRAYDQVNNDRAYLEKQHEGMQARLIESEKSREHQTHIFSRRLNQYDYDRPHAEAPAVVSSSAFGHHNTYSTNTSHVKDSSSLTSSRNDPRELRVPDPSNYFRFDAPVLSKLDLKEKKVREARMNGMYNSDDSASESEDELAKEEKKKEKLLVISAGPPCKLDKSPKKLKYLQQFGLTTKEQKKGKLDFERFTKRRKLYKESSVSPVQMGDEMNEAEGSIRSDDSLSPQAKQHHMSSIYEPDQLNRDPDYQYKCRFLYSLSLQRVTPERRREMDRIRKVCLEDRKRRLGIKSHGDVKHDSHSGHPNHIVHDSSLKRKHGEMESGSHRPRRPQPQRITLGQLHERHLQQQQQHDPASRPSVPSHPATTTDANARAVIYPSESHESKLRSREFAQEFHNEVLQATVKKEISKNQLVGRHGSQSELRYNVETLDAYRSQAATNNSTPQNTNVIHSTKTSTGHEDPNSTAHHQTDVNFKWPGIEAVLESYQKHFEEQRVEQNILIDQCQKLQRTNADLHKTAESLSRRMAELIQAKSRSEDDRLRTQTSIDNLKKSLKVLR